MGWVVVAMVVGVGGGGQVVIALSLQLRHSGLGRAAGRPPPCSTSSTGKHHIDTTPFNPAGGQEGAGKEEGHGGETLLPNLALTWCVCVAVFFDTAATSLCETDQASVSLQHRGPAVRQTTAA